MIAQRTTSRLISLLPIAALHVVAFLAMRQTMNSIRPDSIAAGVMKVFFIEPTKQTEGSDAAEPDLARLMVMTDHPLDLTSAALNPFEYSESRSAGTTISAPTLKGGNPIDMTPFIAQAALLPGEGATVVLRVEVLDTGEPGRMAVDVSSGSRQVDQAAMDYARQLRWFAGRTGEAAQAMWIRWSVRLQA
jgi:TonB family protein